MSDNTTRAGESEQPSVPAVVSAGAVFRVKYPFVLCDVDMFDDDPEGTGFATVESWTPGVRFEPCGMYGEETEAVCDGEGAMVLSVVDVHKPGRFPARVFFTRRWVTPDGKEFGKGKLHVMTAQAFKRRAKGYMHEYELPEEPVAARKALEPK